MNTFSSLRPAHKLTRLTLAVSLVVGLVWTVTPALVARAATISVTTTNDENNNDGDCSLREAIIAANSDAAVDACTAGSGADTIALPAGTYQLTIAGRFEQAAVTGDLDITEDLTLIGDGWANTDVDGNGIDRVFHILNRDIVVTFADLTISGGNADLESGGGVYSFGIVSISSSRIRDNQASNGGGIYLGAGSLDLAASRVDGNVAGTGGGVMATQVSNVTQISDSVIDNNQATDRHAGGLWNGGVMTITNSTVSGNVAVQSGGGLLTVAGAFARVAFNNVTMVNNTADSDATNDGDGGGLWALSPGSVTVRNSLVANNRDQSTSGTIHPECSGEWIGAGYNLIENTTGCNISGSTVGDITGLAPLLGSLRNNGGGTGTHALLTGSPAIDAGTPGGCLDNASAVLFADQRGYARPIDGDADGAARCDIGAFEYDSPGTPTPTPTATHTPTATPTLTATPTAPPACAGQCVYLPLIIR